MDNKPFNRETEAHWREQLPTDDLRVFNQAWELAVQYHEVGRMQEAVEFFLVSAALLEKNGCWPEKIFQTVMRLDGDNEMAASRLKPEARQETRTKIFVEHVMARHTEQEINTLLADERARNWVTPPRESQQTCPECGMGVPHGVRVCAMCGAPIGATYRKRSTASYGFFDANALDAPAAATAAQPADAAASQQTAHPAPAPQASTPAASPVAETALPPNTAVPPFVVLSPDASRTTLASSNAAQVTLGTASGCLGAALDATLVDGLDARHVTIEKGADGFHLHDLDSRTGVFLVVENSVSCGAGQVFQVGVQRLRVEPPPRDGGIAVAHLSNNSVEQTAIIKVAQNSLSIGRADCDLTFPNDHYLSPTHARIIRQDQQLHLQDLASRWGTFLKLPPETTLPPGRTIRVGRLMVRLQNDSG
jgi:hypothetical protein